VNPTPASSANEVFLQRKAAGLSLVVGLALLILKFWAFRVTGSQAVFSDAMESIVNVVAAIFALIVVVIAARPADKDHPYGHGKLEFFSAAFEGGLIAFAAVLICFQAGEALLTGRPLNELNFGVTVVLGAGLVNLLLGLLLLRSGRQVKSPALVASGHHVISDFWTSAGAAAGLVLVSLTGWDWIDPAVALLLGLFLASTGIRLVRRSVGGLLDEEDREILGTLVDLIERDRNEGIIQVHYCRVIRSGRYHHIDAHVVVPEFWDVARAHQETKDFERRLIEDYPYDGELHFHVDPCRHAYCRVCEVQNCPIRQQAFEGRRAPTIDEITSPHEPSQFSTSLS
jgi:cation diffusion facilitator family transporter